MPDTDQIIKLERTRRQFAAKDVDMSGSTFSDVDLSGAAFDDVNLAGATIHNANLSRLRISDANLNGASIDGIAVEDLISAYPDTDQIIKLERTRRQFAAKDVDMSGSTFSDVNLSGAVFDDVNLAGATIHNANLSRLRISDANLNGASIDGIAVEDLIAAYRAANPKAG